MTFVFYDLETTGTSPAFDQPLQFAAIRTDDDFNEFERINFRCRLAPHILPSPHALIVTGVTPEQLVDPTLQDVFTFTHMMATLKETDFGDVGAPQIRSSREFCSTTRGPLSLCRYVFWLPAARIVDEDDGSGERVCRRKEAQVAAFSTWVCACLVLT